MPIWIDQKGEKNQSVAILRYLGNIHGYSPKSHDAAFEADWYFETFHDHVKNGPEGFKKPLRDEVSSDETIEATMDQAEKLLSHYNKRWSDNRKYSAGTTLSITDFHWIGFITGCLDNPHGKNEGYKKAMKAELDKHEHVTRINT